MPYELRLFRYVPVRDMLASTPAPERGDRDKPSWLSEWWHWDRSPVCLMAKVQLFPLCRMLGTGPDLGSQGF